MTVARHALLLLVVQNAGLILAQTCSSLGNKLSQTRFYESWSHDYPGTYRKGKLLDLSVTATCTGKGIAWNYCFYLGWTSSSDVQTAHLLLYRKTGATTYTKVEGSEVVIGVQQQYAPQQRYCNRVALPQPVDVLEGDVIGVCLPDPAYVEPLDVYEVVSGYQLYHETVPDDFLPRCEENDVNIYDISSGWHTHTSRALNVNLEISSAPVSSTQLSSTNTPTSTLELKTSSMITPQPTVSVSSYSGADNIPILSTTVITTSESDLSTSTMTGSAVVSPSTASMLELSTAITNGSTVDPLPTASVEADGKGEQKATSLSFLSLESLVGVAVGGALLLCTVPLCILLAVCCTRKRTREHHYGVSSSSFQGGLVISNLHEKSQTEMCPIEASTILQQLEELQFRDAELFAEPAASISQLFSQLQQLEMNIIPREKIEITQPLGYGQFSVVNRAIWLDSLGMIREVAVKSIVPNCPAEEKMRLLQEAAVMVQFNHSNVLQLYGMVIKNEQVMLVMELAKNGDLQSYLQKLKDSERSLEPLNLDTIRELLSFSKDVAKGMYYLSQKRFVHKNIAARNILLSASKACKIGNFSLSRSGDEVPVRWTAPEVLSSKSYSAAADVWSYGCLLYEIWSFGGLPLEELKHFEVATKVELGYRMSQPPGCPTEIYSLMKQCWQQDPHSRSSFRDILISLLQFADALQHSRSVNRPTPSLAATTLTAAPSNTRETSLGHLAYRYSEEIDEIYDDIDSSENNSEGEDSEALYDDVDGPSAPTYANQGYYYNDCL